MNLLNRYIAQHIFGAVIVTLVVIVGLNLVSAIIDQLSRLEAQYQLLQALQYVVTLIPGMIYNNIPFACLLGCLFGLGSLASNSELVVIRAAGVSIFKIVASVLKPVAMIMLFGMVLGQYIAPVTDQVAESRKALARYGDRGFVTTGGVWTREGNTFMHFSVVQPNGVLYGVSHFRFNDNNEMISARYSDRATYQGSHWMLEGILETQLENQRSSVENYEVLRWDTEITPELLSVVAMSPESLSMTGLWQYSNYLAEQGQNNGEYVMAFWKKMLQPLSTFGLVLVAISFVFGPLRSVTMGFRIFIGAIFGIAFQTSQDMLGPASLVFGVPPIYAALLPAVLCIAIGSILLSRVR
ncbi:MAG TPA: LPS export ABC transporter permease LptG [Pseudomonadales bacterium]|nr:LPS export ABC transporter permease LptG [Pseudomonadales bacterium]